MLGEDLIRLVYADLDELFEVLKAGHFQVTAQSPSAAGALPDFSQLQRILEFRVNTHSRECEFVLETLDGHLLEVNCRLEDLNSPAPVRAKLTNR